MYKSRLPPNQRAHRRPRFRLTSDAERPQLTVASIASWWCGIKRDDDKIELEDLCRLLGLDVDSNDTKPRLIFKTTDDRRLELDIAKYPDSLPVAIGQAVVALAHATWHVRILQNDLSYAADECAWLNDILENKNS